MLLLQLPGETFHAGPARFEVGAAALHRRHHPAAGHMLRVGFIVQQFRERHHMRGIQPDQPDLQFTGPARHPRRQQQRSNQSKGFHAA